MCRFPAESDGVAFQNVVDRFCTVDLCERDLELGDIEATGAVAVVAVVARSETLAVELEALGVAAIARVPVPSRRRGLEAETRWNCGHILGLNL